MCQSQRLVLQTNDRCKTMPVCSPLALLLFRCLTSRTQRLRPVKAGSAPCASTALDNARSYRNEVIDLCAADIIEMRSPQSPSENPLCRRVPAINDGRTACPSDGGGEPCHTVHLFRHKLDAELVSQSSRMCFPDSAMPLTDCVLLWSGGCRHRFAPQVFELLAELSLELSSLVVNQPSWHAKGRDPVFLKKCSTRFWMFAGNHGTNTTSARKVKSVNEAQLVAFIICKNKQINGCRVTELSVRAKSCRQTRCKMLLTLAHIASQLKCCANCSCAATSDTYGSGCPKLVCIRDVSSCGQRLLVSHRQTDSSRCSLQATNQSRFN